MLLKNAEIHQRDTTRAHEDDLSSWTSSISCRFRCGDRITDKSMCDRSQEPLPLALEQMKRRVIKKREE